MQMPSMPVTTATSIPFDLDMMEECKKTSIVRVSMPDLSKPEKIRTPDIIGKGLDEFARRPEQDPLVAVPVVF